MGRDNVCLEQKHFQMYPKETYVFVGNLVVKKSTLSEFKGISFI